jgi:hypothetical protein
MRLLVTITLMLLLGGSCARQDADAPTHSAQPAEDDPESRADALRDRLDAFTRRTFTWQQGDAEGPFTAYFDGDALRYIRASLSFGDYGAAETEYYFADDDALFYYRERSERRVTDPNDPRQGKMDRIIWTLAFGEDGGLIEGETSVNGAPAALEAAKVTGVQAHAEALRAQIAAADPAEAPAS